MFADAVVGLNEDLNRWSSLAILHLVPVRKSQHPSTAVYCTWIQKVFQVFKMNIIDFLLAELLIDQKLSIRHLLNQIVHP